jgi:hypothetical protein
VVGSSVVAQRGGMNKRNVATVLWFFMGWVMGSALAIVVGLPTMVGGALLAFGFAAFIRLGPGRRLWSTEAATAVPASAAVHSGQLVSE